MKKQFENTDITPQSVGDQSELDTLGREKLEEYSNVLKTFSSLSYAEGCTLMEGYQELNDFYRDLVISKTKEILK